MPKHVESESKVHIIELLIKIAVGIYTKIRLPCLPASFESKDCGLLIRLLPIICFYV